MLRIDAGGLHYRELNHLIRQAVAEGESEIVLDRVNGQRYIGDGLQGNVAIRIKGTPGQDLAAFMDGPTIRVEGNAQDAVANTMNLGKVIISGQAGDVLGYAMRGGKLYVGGDAGYRIGIHMKSYRNQVPVIIIGGKVGDFLGEYMAGGVLMVLGMTEEEFPPRPLAGDYLGVGMHGGAIYLRGAIDPDQIGKEISPAEMSEEDHRLLRKELAEFCQDMEWDLEKVLEVPFVKLVPISHRPYGGHYSY
jgi:glutamate synthase domain-containing protein 3